MPAHGSSDPKFAGEAEEPSAIADALEGRSRAEPARGIGVPGVV